MYAALAKVEAPVEGLGAKDFAEPDYLFRMGTPPVMVDIMPRISGLEFEDTWSRRVDVQTNGELSVPFISRRDLLTAKLSGGRAQDLIDVDALRESDESRVINQQRTPASPYANAQYELEKIKKEWPEEWLKLRLQQTRENSPDFMITPPTRIEMQSQIMFPGAPNRGWMTI